MAREAGVVVGMKATQARAMCDALVVSSGFRPMRSTPRPTALADVAGTVSARGRDRRAASACLMDCQGSGALWASGVRARERTPRCAAARCGLPAWIGIADSKLGAARRGA